MACVAREAGVGKATLSRRFATREELITRAKAGGHLREDFTDQDMVVLLMANAGVVAATADAAPGTWRRLVGQVLRAWAAPGADLPPMEPAPAPTALYRAMVRLTRPATHSGEDAERAGGR
ncbi:hypothetical protein [Nonomuraea sp. NPDC002799]